MNTLALSKQSKLLKVFMIAFVVMLSMTFSFVGVGHQDKAYARIGDAGTSTQSTGSQQRLRQAVDRAISKNSYVSKTGDTIPGSKLVKNGVTTDAFQSLTGPQKQKLIDDMTAAVKRQQQSDQTSNSVNPVTDDTVNNWLQDLQQHPGVGSKLLANIMEQVKPDYVNGNRIFEPFAGPLNTLIALVIIVVMIMLTLTFAMDLAYLNIPIFQSFIVNSISERGGGGGSRFTNFFVGREALQAIEESENSSNGKYKNPNGVYLKKRFIGVALLGLCLLYLIQGQIFTLVGMLMDLLGGFLTK